ncbi:hypothetical protein LZ554_000856 [Drepanopeziza brunnea f. sp. 'monogermtubi']|nr:hypothetical protein LZ554_000856 [Drepanopeziza brunnea f. sp. 'monogermtubi']
MAIRTLKKKEKASMRVTYPELKSLPDEWEWFISAEDDCVVYSLERERVKTQQHPSHGRLPTPWVFKAFEDGDWVKLRYWNPETKESTRQDPRYSQAALHAIRRNASNVEGLEITASIRRSGIPLEKCKRAPIGTRNIRAKYEIMHIIDRGDGTGPGVMNLGVFVVRVKDGNLSRLSVEKRFKPDCIELAKREVRILHQLRHPAISFYTAAFFDDRERIGSLYVEFCDRGSLENVITEYSKRRIAGQDVSVPEGFIWHALAGLVDALAYLANGRSFMDHNVTGTGRLEGWMPILHRDIKPDNILIRSRDSIGTKKYPYCILADFGLAIEDVQPGHPLADGGQNYGFKCGTPGWFAPELRYIPYPVPGNIDHKQMFPPPYRHSGKTDLWAVGACIFNLAECEAFSSNGSGTRSTHSNAHLVFDRMPKGLPAEDWMQGLASNKDPMQIRDEYSLTLGRAIQICTMVDPRKRPDAALVVQYLKKAIVYEEIKYPETEDDMLPRWALKVHDYHARKPFPAWPYHPPPRGQEIQYR